MKTFIIEIPEKDEPILIEILNRFKVNIEPFVKGKSTKTTKKNKIEPYTVAHFLDVSKSLSAWNEEDIQKISDIHNQLNQLQPTSW